MNFALNAAFFLSGCAALLFETLWFRQAGLMLGNSVWSSSIVLASFMAGLALGNLGAARIGARLRRPVQAYAGLEAAIGASGLLLVLLFPLLTRTLAPLLTQVTDSAPVLNAVRLTVAFALLLLPASAMGATLPLLVGALGGGQARFGRSLGRLYGWNTLGAVAGALLGEMALIERLGLSGTGAVAASLNLLAALLAARLAQSWPDHEPETAAATSDTGGLGPARALLLAAALSGALLLALEVIWFRFLLLFTMGTSTAFAVMLASVLCGIALGGLLGAAWLKRRPGAAGALPLAALVAGMMTLVTYASFQGAPDNKLFLGLYARLGSGASALWLMLPTSLLSGLLFTLLGQAVRERLDGQSRAAGVLTLANTLGAMFGALLGGLLCLPRLGVESSLVVLGAGYGLVALLAGGALAGAGTRLRRATWAGAALFVLGLALFPYGLMRDTYLKRVWGTFGYSAILSYREGLTETSAYLVGDRWGEPIQYQLVTNSHSMSSTLPRARRYMRLFAYLPFALRPQSEQALLISFGLGSTLDALTESKHLRRIDVVDISKDILEQGRVLFPPPRRYPLDDPRVKVHVEDGRFFLLTTPERFDIITAEPPPPKNAGIVNLYSKEYFALVHSRLREGGLATYWLPVYQMTVDDARAITRGFCDVFADCTLWSGFGDEWMLVGTRGGVPPDEAAFVSPWQDERLRASMDSIGMGLPAQLGTTFLADAEQMRDFLGDARPLEDDFPLRLSPTLPRGGPVRAYLAMMDPAGAQRRFADSAWIRRMWPERLRAATLERFPREYPLLNHCAQPLRSAAWLPELAAMAGDPASRSGMLWMMRSSHAVQAAARNAAARGVQDALLEQELGVGLFVDGRFLEAEEHFRRAQRHLLTEWLVQWRVLALALGGERERAARLMVEAGDWVQPQEAEGWIFLSRGYGLPDPWGLTQKKAAAQPRP